MPDLQTQLEHRLSAAVAAALGDEYADADPLIRPTQDPKFGDFQANLAMGLAKRANARPRDLAEKIVAALETGGLIASAEVAGPGFINLTLAPAAVSAAAAAMLADDRLGVDAVEPGRRVVVDYSAPNVAKEMHVGHLRSTIIGDAIARVLGFLGYDVIRQNHVGDWGTQFGMLIEHLLDEGPDSGNNAEAEAGELTLLYKAARARFDSEAGFADRVRERVVKLQAGDEQTLAVWRRIVDDSKHYFQSIYDRLGVLLTEDDARGESFYNDRLPAIVKRLDDEGHLKVSAGAQVVFPDGFVNKEGDPLPMIVQKSDGGYLYATTDLAAAVFRVDDLGAERVIYVIGLPQRQHFEMFSTMLRQAGWVGDDVRLDFVGFGSVLGEDGKMFKTRSGDTVRLVELVDEAEQRAAAVIAEKNPDLTADQRAAAARAIGIGALKYADLSSDRVKDYTFSWGRMLALEGNTAPYMIYSYVRIRSIFRKGGVELSDADPAAIAVGTPDERQLVLKLAQFAGVIDAVAESLEPHRLCTYLYELATLYHRFFEHCPVLRAETEATKQSRLALCGLTANVIERGLSLLGIGVVERM